MESAPNSPGAGHFPETAWSMILQLHQTQEQRRRGLESLCQRYWNPINGFLRRAMRIEAHNAGDLTQAFFAWLIEAPVLAHYDDQQGSFRSFLLGLLRNFVRNQSRDERALKRGGGDRGVPLEERQIRDPKAGTPEEAFESAWVDELIERATNRVRRQLTEEGKTRELAIFEAYEFPPPGVLPTYRSVADQLSVTPNTVRHQLYRIRERVRAELRGELRETVADADQLEAEWSVLFPGGGKGPASG